MPAAGDKKELGGVARSIDSLFAERTPSPPDAEEERGPDPAFEASTGEPAALQPDILAPDDFDSEPAPVEVEDGPEFLEIAESQPLTIREEFITGSDPSVDLVEDEVAVADEVGLAGEVALVDEAGLAGEVALVDEAGLVGEVAVADEASEELGALPLAVESYLAGGSDAARLRAVIEEHLSERNYDSVAEAVEHLAVGADAAHASEALEVARESLTPLVLSRVAQRLGAERDEGGRERYFEVCRRLGAPIAEAIRDEMAESSDRHARRNYFDALIAMWDVSQPVVEAMAEDDNRFLARNAVGILAEVGGERSVRLIEAALANTDPRVRREALLALARLKVDDADEIILGRLVDDTDDRVRQAAAVAAGELRIERAVRPLVAWLEDVDEPDDVLPLLRALGSIADPGAVPAIEKHSRRHTLGPARTEVRIGAYQALAHIGTPHARRLLNQALSDKDAAVKSAVKELLHIR